VWRGILFAIAGVVWIGVTIVSVKWGWPEILGALPNGSIGVDFFHTPRGYNNLLMGNSIFATELSDYGPYASPYLYHPAVALAVGPWTAPLAPWTAYAVFVGVSLGLLLLSARLLASVFQNPAIRGFTYFAIFCSLPVYMMLWVGQSHVLLVVAVALILSGLMRWEQEPQLEKRYSRWIQLGLAISLLSKPIVVLMLPVLFVTAETRRKLPVPLAVYTVVSLLLLVVERLNPGGYNGIHWLNILQVSSAPVSVRSVLNPTEFDLLNDLEYCSLPVLVDRIAGFPVPSLLFRIPLVAILVLSLSPLVLPERAQRLRAVIVTVLLCILSHYLCYYPVFVYHYTTLLPVLPVLLWLRQRESGPRLRGLLVASFVILLAIFLPTVSAPAPTEPARLHDISTSQRVVPVLLAFLCLTVYGGASAWRERRRPRLITREMMERLWPTCGLAGALGIMLGSVVAAVYGTVPTRWLTTPSRWTKQDWGEHHQATMIQAKRVLDTTPNFGRAHTYLGCALFGQGRPDEAMVHLQRAVEIEPDSAWARCNLGDAFARLRRFDEAIAQYRKALEIQPNDAETHYNLGNFLASRGRLNEATAEFQRTAEIDPGCALPHRKLGAAFARLRRFDEAIAQYRKALEIQPNDAETHYNLGNFLAGRGRLNEAIAEFRQNLKINPDDANAHNNLGAALQLGGRIDDAIAQFQQAVKIKPDDAEAHKNLAWLLASCPQASLRNGDEAVAHAQRADQLCGGKRVDVLGALAAAYAQAGRFPEALTTARKALELAARQKSQAWADVLRTQIALYEAGKPYRQTPSPSVSRLP
jgi:tetratricopeptide (TPR) repeat protein